MAELMALVKIHLVHTVCISLHVYIYFDICCMQCKVTIDLELHIPKKNSSRVFVAHYDVYLYRVPKTKPRTPNSLPTRRAATPERDKQRVLRWEDDIYQPSSPCPICSQLSPYSLPPSPKSYRGPLT